MPDAPTLRPLRIGEILDVAIKIVWRNARTLIVAVLVVAVPLQLLALVIDLSTTPDQARVGFEGFERGMPTVAAEGSTSTAYWTGQALVILISLVITTLATAACFKAVSDAYLGRRASWRQSLRFVLRRVHSVIWLTLLTFVLAALGLVALVVPGVWLWIAWSVAVPALLLEGHKGRRALGRSFRLVKGRWWPTFAAILVGYVLASVVGGIIQGLVLAPVLITDAGDTVEVVVAGVAGIAGAVITTPFQAAIATVIYFDLRVRKEGFDLQLLAERLGLPASEIAVGPLPRSRPVAGEGEGEEQPPYWPPPPGWRPRSAGED